jgi:hypothetical protein
MASKKDNNSEMETPRQRNYVEKYSSLINKPKVIEHAKNKQRRRQPKHRNKDQE